MLKAARKKADEHGEVKPTISKAATTYLSAGEVYSLEYNAMTDQINILKGMIQSKDLNKGNGTDKNWDRSNHSNPQSHYGKNGTYTGPKTPTTSVCPFMQNDRPMKCNRCYEYGHPSRLCGTPGKFP